MRAFIDSSGLVLKDALPSLEVEPSRGLGGLCCTMPNADFDPLNLNDTLISYKNILWVQPARSGADNELEVSYVRKVNKRMQPFTDIMTVTGGDSVAPQSADKLSQRILARAYAGSVAQRSILVIINPHGGKGLALKIYANDIAPILTAARCKVTVKKTTYAGHAVDIAEELDIDRFDMVLCASGDGIPHEVINGFYKRPDRLKAFSKLIVTQTPSGSGNAMSLSCLGTLIPSEAAVEVLKGSVVRTDLMAVCSQSDPVKLSFLSQTYGIIAQADIGTEWIRWIGEGRFELGVTAQVLSRRKFPCDIAVKYIARTMDEVAQYYKNNSQLGGNAPPQGPVTEHSFDLKYYEQFKDSANPSDVSNLPGWENFDQSICNNMGIFYAGNMPYMSKDTNFFPAALPNDGSIDVVVTDVRSGILKTTDALLNLDKGLHVWREEIQHFKAEAFRVVPKPRFGTKPFISVDGENFPLQPFQVEVLRGLMKTVMRDGAYTETGFREASEEMTLTGSD